MQYRYTFVYVTVCRLQFEVENCDTIMQNGFIFYLNYFTDFKLSSGLKFYMI